METLTFRSSGTKFLRTMSTCTAIVAVIAFIGIRTNSSHPALLLTVDALLLILIGLFVAGDRTTVNSDGIRIRRAFVVTSFYAWSEIASVHEQQRKSASRLKMRLTNGDEYNLPYLSTATSQIRDPEYSANRDRIIAYWQQRTAVADAD